MDPISVKKELESLYNRHWTGYYDNIRSKEDSSYPFLILPYDKYFTASYRVMVCGQETMSWEWEGRIDPKNPVESLMKQYESFIYGKAKNSPIWNFEKRLRKALPAAGFVSNNIVKIGKRKGAGCDENIFRLGLEHFPVVHEEIDILKPDLVLFLTGKDYDGRIRAVLGDFTSQPIDADRYIQRLKFADPTMPPAIKTYHPGYIQRKGWYHDYASAIINEIKQFAS